MNGIFPADGIAPSEAVNAYVPETPPVAGCVEQFYSPGCVRLIDTSALNALISELLAVIDGAGIAYDCSKLTNLAAAITAREAVLIARLDALEARVDALETP